MKRGLTIELAKIALNEIEEARKKDFERCKNLELDDICDIINEKISYGLNEILQGKTMVFETLREGAYKYETDIKEQYRDFDIRFIKNQTIAVKLKGVEWKYPNK